MVVRCYYSMSDIIGSDAAKSPSYAESNQTTFQNIFSPLYDSITNLDTPESNKLLQKYLYPRFYNQDIFYIDLEYNPYDGEMPEEPTDLMATPEGREAAGRIISWLREGQETYGEMAKIYENQISHLMDQVKASSTTNGNSTTTSTNQGVDKRNTTNSGTNSSTLKGNNTPQILDVSEENDGYVNNMNKTVSSNQETGEETYNSQNTDEVVGRAENTIQSATDNDTVINRLDEIRKKLVSIYGTWANSFREFIIYD